MPPYVDNRHNSYMELGKMVRTWREHHYIFIVTAIRNALNIFSLIN